MVRHEGHCYYLLRLGSSLATLQAVHHPHAQLSTWKTEHVNQPRPFAVTPILCYALCRSLPSGFS